ncbi:MAG: SAM-dependent chlorinase/fluorinase [Planctomycetes bacterium]|nr:SAM-dependent chlorinase/fluorinase [Planctomycetota bacterium]
MASENSIIALLSDFGVKDYYVGAMKGVILSINPRANVVDISHNVVAQDVAEAGFTLSGCVPYFPTGTIFVSVVDPGVGSDRSIILVETDRHKFLAPDNGLLSLVMANETVVGITEVTNSKYFLENISSTFHGRDIFAPCAAHLSLGVKVEALGKPLENPVMFDFGKPDVLDNGALVGRVVHIDRFGNLVTNITREHLNKFLPSISEGTATVGVKDDDTLNFGESNILIDVTGQEIAGISKSYASRKSGQFVAVFGSTGRLEISVVDGSAAHELKSGRRTPVIIQETEGSDKSLRGAKVADQKDGAKKSSRKRVVEKPPQIRKKTVKKP